MPVVGGFHHHLNMTLAVAEAMNNVKPKLNGKPPDAT